MLLQHRPHGLLQHYQDRFNYEKNIYVPIIKYCIIIMLTNI